MWQVGFRLGRHLTSIVPLFLGFIEKDFGDEDDSIANDLREICFQVLVCVCVGCHRVSFHLLSAQALESFVFRCPAEIAEFLPAIIDSVRKFIEFDPNYTYCELRMLSV